MSRCVHLCSSNLLGGTVGAVLETALGVVLLSWAVDSNFDSDLTTFNLLSVHFRHSLLLHFFTGEGDEAEATALARLVASLKLLDHEARDGAQGNLGRAGFVGGEEFLELDGSLVCIIERRRCTYLLLTEVVRQVSDHDLDG
jgi:hypothetical protein